MGSEEESGGLFVEGDTMLLHQSQLYCSCGYILSSVSQLKKHVGMWGDSVCLKQSYRYYK